MSFPDFTADLAAAMPDLRGNLTANQPLAPFTWFHVGGPAQVLFTPADEDDLAYFLARLDPGDVRVQSSASAPIFSCATADRGRRHPRSAQGFSASSIERRASREPAPRART